MADEFNTVLEDFITTSLEAQVGVGSNPTNYVKTWNDHLEPFTADQSPLLVVAVRQGTPANINNIGATPSDKTWQVDLYYLALESDYTTGKKRRDYIVNKIWNYMDTHPFFIGSLTHVDDMGITTQLIGSNPQGVTFDVSGQEGYYSFVSELGLNVDTTAS